MQIVAKYEAYKLALAKELDLSNPECHVHAGLIIYFAVVLVMRRPLSSPWPLIAVTIAELLNEGMDWLSAGMKFPPDTLSDIVRTLLWPLAIFVTANFFEYRRKAAAQREAEAETEA
jgi:hypothetical protein